MLIGDSAGGNLAARLAVRAKGEGLLGIAGQVLIYPRLAATLFPVPTRRWRMRRG